jgi:hypothetical protein
VQSMKSLFVFRVETVEELHNIGLFLNDYGNSDCNREIIMASVQKSDDLKDMLKTVSIHIPYSTNFIYLFTVRKKNAQCN